MRARFDDLTRGGQGSFELRRPVGEIVAHRADEVRPAIEAVEVAARRGRWAAGWIAYEAAPGLDPTLTVKPPGPVPLVWFGVFADRVAVAPPARPAAAVGGLAWAPMATAAGHARAVAAIREEIAAGQTYQANYTVRFRAPWEADPSDVYAAIVHGQLGAYHGLVGSASHLVLCASPELFLDWDGDRLTTRPMKGTSPRGRWPAEDRQRALALHRSPKDRAENVMIVDLLRNDLGRVAVCGSVRVERLWSVERYETLWQLTSTVAAEARREVGLVEVMAATFPCGSVTGAPKRRTMEIIAGLEDSPRGVYCGAVGWVGPSPPGRPRVRLAVAIRTVTVDVGAGVAEYGAGGGITWTSDAAGEWAEVLAKTQVLSTPRPAFDLVETLAWSPAGGWRHLDEHLDRLAASAAYFGYPCDRAAIGDALRTAVGEGRPPAGRPMRVRLTLGRAGEIGVTVGDLPAAEERPLTLAVDEEPVDGDDVFLHHKTTRREVYERRRARHPGVDDVVLVNQRGEVTESTIANLAVRLGDRWWTPPQGSGCLAGVERGRLLATGRLAERVITVEELTRAEAIALVSSVRGWRPAVLDGPLTAGAGAGPRSPLAGSRPPSS